MSKVVSIKFEWKYEPSDYLEEAVSFSFPEYELSIFDGIAEASVDPAKFEASPNMKDSLTRIVESRLDAVRVLTHKDYKLTRPTRVDLREDGTRNIFLEIESGVLKLSSSPIDLVVKDSTGKIVSDTRRERIDREKWFADAVSKFRALDKVLDQMLTSYQSAVADPENELLYLYEIRDAITSRFKTKKNSLKQLSIVEKDWSLLGDLANRRSIKQSRHRGEFAGELRDADVSELNMAREIAVSFIEKYLVYLESNSD